jgi:sugar lactone lactonase YvrE
MHKHLTVAAGLWLAACTGFMSGPIPVPPGDGSIKNLTPAAQSTQMDATFRTPLDATLSPDGKTAYFVAVESDEAAVYKTAAPSTSAPTKLAGGAPLATPFGIDITSDGNTLVLSDADAVMNPDQPQYGELFALSTSGGTPQVVSGASGYRPRAVIVVTEAGIDVAYFSGTEPSSGLPGVFKVPVTGGTVTTVAKDAPLTDPSGLTVASDGTVYLIDADDPGTGTARLMKVSGGMASQLKGGLAIGYPAGIALSQDEKTVLVSALDPSTHTDAVLRVPAGGGDPEVISAGIDTFEEPAGLHRAKNVDAYIWADSRANGGGTVYVINKQQ